MNKTNEKSPEDIVLSRPERPDLPSALPGSRRALLIPAFEHTKLSGFKKSGSLRRKQDTQQEVGVPVQVNSNVEVTNDHCSASSEEVVAEPSEKVTAKPSEKVTAKPYEKVTAKPSEKVTAKPSEKVAAKPSEKVAAKPLDVENDGNVVTESGPVGEISIVKTLKSSLDIGDSGDTRQRRPQELSHCSAPMRDPRDLKETPGEKCNSNVMKKPMINPTSMAFESADGSQQMAPATSRTVGQNGDSKIDHDTVPKATKVKSTIGSVWGDMASRKEPGFAVFSRGKKNKMRGAKVAPWNPSRPQWSPPKAALGENKTAGLGGKNDRMLSHSQVEEINNDTVAPLVNFESTISPRAGYPTQYKTLPIIRTIQIPLANRCTF